MASCTASTPQKSLLTGGKSGVLPAATADAAGNLDEALVRERERGAALEQQLDERSQEITRLQREIARLQEHEADLRAALRRALMSTETGPDGTAAASRRAAAARRQRTAETETAGALAGARAALAEERERRRQVESELARLKEETSTSPYAAHSATDTDLANARQEVSQLQTALQDERAARERLAEDFRALQERAATHASTSEFAEVSARVKQLEQEKQAITESFNRSLAASQERAAALEHDLAIARSASAVAPTTDPNLSSVQAENATLRTQLDEEHRRTEELAAKLRIAMRVTDLIFKMQGQQAASRP